MTQSQTPASATPTGGPAAEREAAAAERARQGDRERQLRRLRDQTIRWQNQIRDEFATISSDVDFDMRRRVQHVLAAAEASINELDPNKSWNTLTTWLRERLAFELEQNHAMAVSAMRAVSVSSARHFGLDETQIIDPQAPRVPTDLSVSLASAPSGPGGRGSGVIMNVALRAYIGFVMFFMVSNFSGLALPIVFGIAPALLLAGVALNEERNRQVAMRRVSANQVIRSYITEYGMWVSKDSRDLLRRLEQELRNGYEARIEQL
jgi:hypothetical protein